MAIKWIHRGCDAKQGIWITTEDKIIPISEMTTEHIHKCIDFIRIRGGKLQDSEISKIDELEDELLKRDHEE